MTTHDLKTWPEFFAPVATGVKTFEVRRDDRGFRVGDRLRLREWKPWGGPPLDEEARQRLRAVWHKRHVGVENAHKVAELSDGEDAYTGREVTVTVTYILRMSDLPNGAGSRAVAAGYVAMAIALRDEVVMATDNVSLLLDPRP